MSQSLDVPGALWRRRWLIIPFVLLGIVGSLAAFNNMTRLYRGTATVILVPQSISDTVYSQRFDDRDLLKTLELELSSLGFLEALARKLGLDPTNPDEARDVMEDFGMREVDPETFHFQFVDADPVYAARLANAVAHTFVEEHRQRKVDGTLNSAGFLKEEIQRLENELDGAKKDLARYQSRHRGELPSDRDAHRSEQTFLRQMMADLDSRIEAKKKDRQQRLAMLGRKPGTDPGSLVLATDPRQDQATTLREELATARLRYTDKHPQVLRLQASLKALLDDIRRNPAPPAAPLPVPTPAPGAPDGGKDALKQFLALEISRIETEINEMQAEKAQSEVRVGRLENLIRASFARETEIEQLEARIDLLEGRLLGNQGDLQTLETERKVFEKGMDERFAVKRDASPPMLPFRPDLLTLLLLGTLGGFAVGAGLAILRDMMDTTVRTPADVEELTRTAILVAIPDMNKVKGGQASSQAPRRAARG